MDTLSEAQWMHYYACLVLLAGMPQEQRPKPGPDASEEEIASWLRDSEEGRFYDDPHLSIDRWSAHVSDFGPSYEINISLPDDDSGHLGAVVLKSYQSWDNPERLPMVDVFEPGPWCAHLVTLAHRAATVLQGRPGAEPDDFYVHHDRGRDA